MDKKKKKTNVVPLLAVLAVMVVIHFLVMSQYRETTGILLERGYNGQKYVYTVSYIVDGQHVQSSTRSENSFPGYNEGDAIPVWYMRFNSELISIENPALANAVFVIFVPVAAIAIGTMAYLFGGKEKGD
jgi:hypothetical protein